MIKKLLLAAALIVAASAPALPQAGQFPSGYVQGNSTASPAQGKPNTVTAILDRALGSTRGALIERGAAGWGLVGPGTVALPLVSAGAGADPLYQVLGYAGGGTNATSQTGAQNNIFPTPTRAGDVAYWNGSNWTSLAGNNSGTNVFSENASGVPSWVQGLLAANNLSDVASRQTAINNLANCPPTRAGDMLYYNGTNWVCLAGNNSGTQVLSENPSGVPSWSAAGSGTLTSIVCDGVTITTTGTCPPSYGFKNCSITASAAGNNLTVALKDNAGSDPSATSPCNVYFRNATLTTGSWTQVTTTGALSFTANAGSTFGITNTAATCLAASSCPFKLWVVGINSGSGLVLGVVALTNASGVLPLNEGILLTSTACNACVNATALGTIYSTAAQASKSIIILGYLEWGSGLGTAGTYASAPTAIQTMGIGIRRPGEVIQDLWTSAQSTTTGSGTTYVVTTPSLSITPTMSSNLVETLVVGNFTQNTTVPIAQVHRAAGGSSACTTPIPGTIGTEAGASSENGPYAANAFDTPATTSQQTYVVCIKSSAANNVKYCDQSVASVHCTMRLREIMGTLSPANDNGLTPQTAFG